MAKDQKRNVWLILGAAVICLLAALFMPGGGSESESIKEVMRDAVLHETGKISLFGFMNVNPSVISGFTVTLIVLIFALLVRIFVIPRFTYVPGRFQVILEEWVHYFDQLAQSNSPHRNGFLGVYLFGAGSYIFLSTLFELLGLQGMTIHGSSITLPAPLSDINAAIALGSLSYLVIMTGGIAGNGIRGIGKTLKEISLLVSMSFRLFGALLSGLLVTELVYYYIQLSFVLPVAVGVMFTLLHALIQAYVLTMLTALYYGEVSEPVKSKNKKKNEQ